MIYNWCKYCRKTIWFFQGTAYLPKYWDEGFLHTRCAIEVQDFYDKEYNKRFIHKKRKKALNHNKGIKEELA